MSTELPFSIAGTSIFLEFLYHLRQASDLVALLGKFVLDTLFISHLFFKALDVPIEFQLLALELRLMARLQFPVLPLSFDQGRLSFFNFSLLYLQLIFLFFDRLLKLVVHLTQLGYLLTLDLVVHLEVVDSLA